MRPRVAITVLLGAVLLLGVAALLSNLFRGPSEPPPTENATRPRAEAASTRPADRTAARPVPRSSFTGSNTAIGATPASNDLAHSEYVRRRIAELDALAMKDDAVSRDMILSELQNPDRAIRKGALEAAIQFNDRSVIPRLQEAAALTEDPAEKAEILEAIEYIKLPSLTEYLAEQKARRESMALTNPSLIVTNRRAQPLLPPPPPSPQNNP